MSAPLRWFRIDGLDKMTGEAVDFRVPAKDTGVAERWLWKLGFATSNVRDFALSPGIEGEADWASRPECHDLERVLAALWYHADFETRHFLIERGMQLACGYGGPRHIAIALGWQWFAEWPEMRRAWLKADGSWPSVRAPFHLAALLKNEARSANVEARADRIEAGSQGQHRRA